MPNRGLKGAVLFLIGLGFILGGIWIHLASDRPFELLRLIGLGAVLSICGVWILFGGNLPALGIDPHWSARFGLYCLSALSLGGSIFLTAYAIRKRDDRVVSLPIAAGILIVGFGSLVLARRLR